MKRITLVAASVVMIAGMFFITSCSKTEDTEAPVITLTGNNPDRVELFSAASYTDPGYTVTDDVDKVDDITVTVDGLTLVNLNSAGNYNVNYVATDKAGNSTTETRVVTIDGALYLDNFNYMATDHPTGGPVGTPFAEFITSSDTVNRIKFLRFADYDNAVVYATISGTTITVAAQTVMCGNPAANRTFSGYGGFTEDFTSFQINYTETTNGTSVTGYTVYVKQ